MRLFIFFIIVFSLFAKEDLRMKVLEIDEKIIAQLNIDKNSTKKIDAAKEKNIKVITSQFPELAEAELKIIKIKDYVVSAPKKSSLKKIKKVVQKISSLQKPKKKSKTTFKIAKKALAKEAKKETKEALVSFTYNSDTKVTLQMVVIGEKKIAVVDDQFFKIGDTIKGCKIVYINLNGINLKCNAKIKSIKIGEQW